MDTSIQVFHAIWLIPLDINVTIHYLRYSSHEPLCAGKGPMKIMIKIFFLKQETTSE